MAKNNAVIVGRFQAHILHAGYSTLFNEANKYDQLMIVVCNADQIGTEKNPLSFEAREEIIKSTIAKTITIPFTIVFLDDCSTNEIWSEHLDFLVNWFGFKDPDFLVSRDSFKNNYTGKFKNNFVELETVGDFSSTTVRRSAKPNSGNPHEESVWRARQIHQFDLPNLSSTKLELLTICFNAILCVDDNLVVQKKLTDVDLEEDCAPSLGIITIDRCTVGSSISIDGKNITNYDMF